ncbi:hypothetical protein RYX36_009028, partial [Vicia faba]
FSFVKVCPMFGAPLIKKILHNFFPDEFFPDLVPIHFCVDMKQNDMEHEKELDANFPCNAAPISYSPHNVTSIASILGEIGSKSQLRRNKSSVVRKSYTSDDELNELKSPLSSIFLCDSMLFYEVLTKSNLMSKDNCNESPVRYDLLRDVWMSSN